MPEIKAGMSWRRFILLYNCLSSASVTVELQQYEKQKLQSGVTEIGTDRHLDRYLKSQFGD